MRSRKRKRVFTALPANLNKYITSRNQSLSAWASVATLISIPLVLVGIYIGYVQIRDLLIKPSIELEFVHPSSVAYTIKNTSDKTVENVLVAFGIFDIDASVSTSNIVPITSRSYDYVNKRSANGPIALLGEYGKPGHRYFGIVYAGCKGCEDLETYWLYARHGSTNESFYAKRTKQDTYQLDWAKLTSQTEQYLEQLVPKTRRIYIRN